MSQPTETKRQLRHKHRKVYADTDIDEDDIEGKRTYDLNEKLQSNRYNADFVSEMKGDDVTLKYFQESGFSMPFLVKEKTGLGIRIPSQNFHVSDVKRCVGSRRILDVMDVNTQKAMNMNMKDWVTYYEDKSDRERLLNVISLEFSHTKLETYVQQPAVVRQVDWVENSWPQFLKDLQRETTNLIDRMMYPKVQKYTLMSVAGCYTDFHIDMGGTSVWYHILHGKKIFWLIPPTDENLAAYESWIMSANQGEVFLADTVTGCERVELEEGYTFFIPSGWIHAVYTPVDSLVFGGNFLHSYGITMQLKVWQVESKTHVAGKFRYPFFVDIHWYVLQRYVSLLTGKEHRVKSDEELSQEITRKPRKKLSVDSLDLHDDRSNDSMASDPSFTSETDDFKSSKSRMSPFTSNKQNIEADQLSRSVSNDNDSLKAPMCVESSGDLVKRIVTSKEWTHLTCYERQGLKAILELFDHLPRSKWSVPVDIPNPLELLDDTRSLLSEHAGDEQDQAASGTLLLKWPERKKPKAAPRQHSGTPRGHGVPKPDWKNKTKGKERSGNRHRRVRCKLCEPCTRTECRECKFCRDMKKFGGSGTMKQCCISKQCLAPVLANKAHCSICGHQEISNASLSDWTIIHVDVDVSGGALYECSGCWEIVHPYCVLQRDIKLKKEDLLKEEALVKDEVKSEADATADGATGLPEGGAISTEIKLEVVVSAEEVQEVVSALKYREALVNEDLPSSWECPRCCDQDKVQQLKDSIKEMNKSQEDSGKQDNNASSAVETTSMNPQAPIEGTSDTTPTKPNTIDGSFLSPPTMTPHKNSPEPRSIPSNLSPPDISPVPPAITRPNVANDSRQSIFDVLSSQSLSPTSENRAPTMTEKMNLQLMEGPPSITPDVTSNVHTEKIVSPMMEAPGLTNCDVLMATEETTAARVASPNTTPTSSKITTAYSDTSANEQSPSPPPPPAEDLAATLRAAKQQKATALYDFDSSSPRSLTSDHGDATPEKTHRRPIENGGKSAGNGQKRKNGNTPANTSNGSQEKKAKTEDTPKGGTSNNDSTTPPSGQPLKITEEPLDPPASRTIPQHMKTCSLMVHKYVVRPAPTHNLPRRHQMDHADGPDSTVLSIREWMTIFSYLFPHELCTVMCVCKAWCQWAMQPSLWQNINLVRKTIKKACLIGIIRRQPRTLDLSWTNINSVRFTWLITRLPQLRGLCFRGNHWTAASAMCSASCPLLYDLDLSWVQGVKDDCMRDLLPPPVNHRPGVDCSLSRMRRLTTLSISGTDIGDGTLLLVSQHLVSLVTLDVSFCIKVTNKGLTHLADKKSVVKTTILNLDLSACKQLTDDCLKSLHLLTSLITFCLADSPNIPPEGAEQFRNNFNKNRRKMSHNAGVAYKPLVLHLNDTLQVCQS